jgi:hydroxymethylpyrimidine pyrophosphatase-like HAD family hydrolase
MRSWSEGQDWFKRFAESVARVKGFHLSEEDNREVAQELERTFKRIYRAVAFDIDGTLTASGEDIINPRMAQAVGRLLQRGIPVILITGRGRGSTKIAARAIKEHSQLSDWYMRRLQCVTSNGVLLLHTPNDNPSEMLSLETHLTDRSFDPRTLDSAMHNLKKKYPEMSVSEELHAIRLVFESEGTREDAEKRLLKLLGSGRYSSSRYYVSRGEYARLKCLDVCGTNKQEALDAVAHRLGISSEKILRIGDQGQDGGNDYHLLASSSGFSVGYVSRSPFQCFPVLDDNLQRQLFGAEATEHLLERVLLFSPLSIPVSQFGQQVRSDLRSFERIALTRSRKERETVTQRIRVRLRYLLGDGEHLFDVHTLDLSEIFDDQSGGIKFREWEFDVLPQEHPARRLFNIPNPDTDRTSELHARWCMYTDTGILMRGPGYYFGQTTPLEQRNISSYAKEVKLFLRGAADLLIYLTDEEPDLTRFKLVLALQDNLRNMFLILLYAAFYAEELKGQGDWRLTNDIFSRVVLVHTKNHYNFLLNPDAEWTTAVSEYMQVLDTIIETMPALAQRLYEACQLLTNPADVFKWRECDNFLQNVAAVQLAFHEFRQRQEIRDKEKILAIGLAYGGTELPGIAKAVAEARGFELLCGLAKVSIYGDPAVGEMVRAGEHDYVVTHLMEKPLCILEEGEVSLDKFPVIIMDDNCTTAITLQLARDFLVTLGADVVGSVVVRFPGINRHVQMAMAGHGFPDPQVLFSFVRGLVAPSPYSRLVYEGSKRYLDSTSIFDKSRERIQRHLKKNGTPFV